jgi:hypothetical protein
VADRILVFHRGVGKAHMRGLLINEKLDLLTEYTVMRVLDKVLPYIPAFLGGGSRGAAATDAPSRALSPAEDAAAAEAAREFVKLDSALAGERKGGTYIASDHKYAKVGGGARAGVAGEGPQGRRRRRHAGGRRACGARQRRAKAGRGRASQVPRRGRSPWRVASSPSFDASALSASPPLQPPPPPTLLLPPPPSSRPLPRSSSA